MSDITSVEYYIPLDGDAEKIGLRRTDGELVEVYLGEQITFTQNEFTGSSALAVDANFDFITINLGGSVDLTSFDVGHTICVFTLILKQDATGGRIVDFPPEVIWAGGEVPTLSTDPDAIDVLMFFTTSSGSTWYGFPAGIAMGVPV